MRTRFGMLLLVLAALVAVAAPAPASAQDCACRDANHNGICDPSETLIPAIAWIGPGAPGPIDVRPDSFTIPEGCEFLVNAGTNPVQVTARNVFIYDDIRTTSSSGRGLLFIADHDVVVGDVARSRLTWRWVGQNVLLPKVEANTAIARATVAFKAGRDCVISNAFIEAAPIGGNQVIGMQCRRDIFLRAVEFYTSGFDIQSLEGIIDASNVGAGGGNVDIRWCDPGLDGTIDLPCTISDTTQLASVCDGTFISVPLPGGAGAGVNKLRALAYGGTLIARGEIRLQSESTAPSSQNVVEGRYGVTIISEQGDVNLTNAKVTNTSAPLGGADIFLAAGPASVDRYRRDIMKETFAGGCNGIDRLIMNTGTCFQSLIPIKYCGSLAGNTGPSPTPPCRADLVPVNSGGGF